MTSPALPDAQPGIRNADETQSPRNTPMPTETVSVPLLPCPFCGAALRMRSGVNGYGHCKTEGCHANRAQIVPLDDPKQVSAWNRRAAPPAPMGEGEPVAWEWSETGTDTDGDPKKFTGKYGDYVAVVILSRLSKLWNAHVNNGRGKLGFKTEKAARAYAMEVVAGMLALRLQNARETFALYAAPTPPLGGQGSSSPCEDTHRDAEGAVPAWARERFSGEAFNTWAAEAQDWSGSAWIAGERTDEDDREMRAALYAWLCKLGCHLSAWSDLAFAQQAAASTAEQPGTSAFASDPNMTPLSRHRLIEIIGGEVCMTADHGDSIDPESVEDAADAILQALAQPAQDGGAS